MNAENPQPRPRPSQERQESSMEKATSEFVETYKAEKDLNLSGLPHPNQWVVAQRDKIWKSLAERHITFKDNILQFRERMKVVQETDKRNEHTDLNTSAEYAESSFFEVEDPYARNILGEILLSRMLNEDGVEEDSRIGEDDLMSSEMGLSDEDDADGLTIEMVAEQVLSGSLRVVYRQPQPES